MTFRRQISIWACTWTLLVGAGGPILFSASAQETTFSEPSFGCILDWPKVRNTRFKHADPEKLKEAMRIFRESEPDKEYPVGTILQLVPFEAMVKHPHDKFPKSNGWEFFALEVWRPAPRSGIGGTSTSSISYWEHRVKVVISRRRSSTSCVKRATAVLLSRSTIRRSQSFRKATFGVIRSNYSPFCRYAGAQYVSLGGKRRHSSVSCA
jgi:hypothetical protein